MLPTRAGLTFIAKHSVRLRGRLTAACLGLCLASALVLPAFGLETRGMKAPRSRLVAKPAQRSDGGERPAHQGLLLGSIRLFQTWISPIDGPRCRFSPTCSQFGYLAIRKEGPVFGVMMTADRLMRCNHWTAAGDYVRLRHGALHDPIEQNLLSSP